MDPDVTTRSQLQDAAFIYDPPVRQIAVADALLLPPNRLLLAVLQVTLDYKTRLLIMSVAAGRLLVETPFASPGKHSF